MADGYISQIKTPDNKVYDFRDQHLKVYTGSCTTAAGTAIKDVTTDGEFTLAKGAVIFVNFSATNTAAVADLKLRVNSNAANDAKPIKHEYNASEANLPGVGYLRANQTYQFYYDGTNWVTDVGRDANSTYSYMRPYENTGKGSYNSQGENPAKTGSAGWRFQLSAGKYFMYSHYYDNTAKSALTLNIGSTGAKPIYINGQPSSADNYTLPGGQYLVYYDGTNYYFRTDDKMTGNITGNAATASSIALSGVTGADDLKAIEALTGTNGLLKKTAANTWTLDTNAYSLTSHNHNSAYLKLDGSNNMTADVNIIAGDTDKFVNFWFNTNKTAGGSWRVGMLGSGSGNTNYFVIQSGTSTTSATTWNNALKIGQNNYDIYNNENRIPNTGNATGSVGDTTTPVYVDAGVIKAGTALKALAYKDSLTSSDIPDLSWNKIASDIPTTLSGYGITDAAASNHSHTLTIGNKSLSVSTSEQEWTVHDILKTSTGIGTDTSWDQYEPGVYYVASGTTFTGTNNPENTNTNNGITPYHYGQLIVSRAATGGVAQFYISHNDSNNANYGIHYRTGWNNTYVAKWSVLLDSQNYTNYAVAKTAGVTAVTWDATNKKITKTINGTTSDVVTAETLKAAMNITASDLDISNALHFVGITSTTLADGSTTTTLTPKSTGSLNKTTGFVDGDVVMDGDQLREYVWSGDAWRLLGITTSTAYIQPASTATNTWIAQVSQGTDGRITATTGSLDTSGTWSGNAVTASSAAKLTTARNLGVALGSTTAVTFDGSANQTSIPVSGTLGIAHGGTGATSAADARTNLNTVTGNARVFYGTCTTAAATTLKEVICAEYDKVLTIGDMLIVKFDNTNSGAVGSLQITVKNSTSDSDGTTAKNIKRQYNSTGANNLVATGELNKDSIAVFVYNGTYWILTNADYNNTYSYDWTTGAGGNGRTAETAANGGVGIHRYSLQMMTLNLTWSSLSSDYPTAATTNGAATDKTVATCSFLLDSPIIYQDTNANAIPGNSANVNGFTTGAINLQYSTTNTQWSALTIQKPVYLIGTVQSDGTFKLNATKWWTQTLPTSDDGQIYIFLGLAYSATNIYLHDAHPIYWYKNGEIQPYAGYATATSRAAITTTANAVAYYTNTTGTFGSKASANGALYATAANGALQWGTLPIAQGGTGVTSFTKNQVILSDNTNGTTGLTSRAYSDSTAAGALSSTSTNFVTERDVYFGLPTLNNAHNYTSDSTYYAPTAGGTAGHILIGAGATTAPAWYGGTVMSGTAAASWITAFNGTTDATATNAAAVTIAGGLGISKKLHVGSTATVPDLTIGSTNEYGDAYTPIYWHEGVPTVVTLVQQCAFAIKSGMSGVKLSHTAITANSYVTQIVVTSGEANLNSAISWTSAAGYIELTCSSTVSGDVTGYIMISRGGEITATATDIT